MNLGIFKKAASVAISDAGATSMDAKMKGIVRVVPYDPEWKTEFLKIKAMIVGCVGDL